MVYTQPNISPGECYTQASLGYGHIQTDHLISAKRPNQQKKRTCNIVDFVVSADHRVQLKESEKKNKYLNFTRELKKL